MTAAPAVSSSAHEVAMRYFDAWNERNPDAIVATFAAGGTYSDPSAGTLSGPAIGGYAASLFAAFPDLSFDIVSLATTDAGEVVAEWVMCGMNTGPFLGAPPTGATIALPGADFITVATDGIRSVRGYFDQRAFVEQLGLQVLVQPHQAGPFAFGRAVSATRDSRTTPGAFSVTSLTARSAAEVQEIANDSRQIATELLQSPGFLSWIGVTIGNRMVTITAWEDTDASRQLIRGGTHRQSMAKFFGTELAAGGVTSVWAPHRINPTWVRCPLCNTMTNADKADDACTCGATLPYPPPFF